MSSTCLHRRKEICIHRMLSHDNVIKFYGHRKTEDVQYLFLEYASGGELFDRCVCVRVCVFRHLTIHQQFRIRLFKSADKSS